MSRLSPALRRPAFQICALELIPAAAWPECLVRAWTEDERRAIGGAIWVNRTPGVVGQFEQAPGQTLFSYLILCSSSKNSFIALHAWSTARIWIFADLLAWPKT